MDKVVACIDDTPDGGSVCAHAAWAARRLGAPLVLLHVLDLPVAPAPADDLTAPLGLGLDAQQLLLGEVAVVDEQRAQRAREQGRLLLETACRQATQAGATPWELRQRHGALADTLAELEAEARLFVLGPGRHHLEDSPAGRLHLDHGLERVLRAVQRPVLVGARRFEPPGRFMIAFDGSPGGRAMVECVATSPLLRGLPAHLVTADGNGDAGATPAALQAAADRLAGAGFELQVARVPGEAQAALAAYQREHAIPLLVMGAYGHSRLRQLLLGSTTSTLLRSSAAAVLVLR